MLVGAAVGCAMAAAAEAVEAVLLLYSSGVNCAMRSTEDISRSLELRRMEASVAVDGWPGAGTYMNVVWLVTTMRDSMMSK